MKASLSANISSFLGGLPVHATAQAMQYTDQSTGSIFCVYGSHKLNV